jgi:hypothetical protein
MGMGAEALLSDFTVSLQAQVFRALLLLKSGGNADLL